VYARLADGKLLLLRPIRPDDKRLLAYGTAGFSRETLARRFLTPKRRLSSAELRYLTEVDGHDHVAYVAVLPHDPQRLIAVGRWVRLHDRPDTAEVAITVADKWQNRGLGSLVGAALADEARFRGVHRFTATMQADNAPAHRLMEKLTDRLEQRHDGPLDELAAELAA
jgi:RimJ/RimL family protein N-acetyltransferase